MRSQGAGSAGKCLINPDELVDYETASPLECTFRDIVCKCRGRLRHVITRCFLFAGGAELQQVSDGEDMLQSTCIGTSYQGRLQYNVVAITRCYNNCVQIRRSSVQLAVWAVGASQLASRRT